MIKDIDLDHCYGCGKDNPSGLHLEKRSDGENAWIEFEVRPEHTGYPGLLHGGLICVLLDEVMFHAVAMHDVIAVLANINVDFKNPAFTGDRLRCEARMISRDGRKIRVAANIRRDTAGAVVAEGEGLFIEVDLDKLLPQ